MDSQENILEQGNAVEEKQVEPTASPVENMPAEVVDQTTPDTDAPQAAEAKEAVKTVYSTKQEVLKG